MATTAAETGTGASGEARPGVGSYLVNVFVHPRRAFEALAVDRARAWRLAVLFFVPGVAMYVVVVALGYQALGWDAFPYRRYYPGYPDPYWWELLVVPLWGLVLVLGYSVPGYVVARV